MAVMELAPNTDEWDQFVNKALARWADPGAPGMHRTPTMDYGVVLEGDIGLELDNGAEVTLKPGDVVVQNGTRHRWHNRGDSVARLLVVTVGAHHRIEGGRPTGCRTTAPRPSCPRAVFDGRIVDGCPGLVDARPLRLC